MAEAELKKEIIGPFELIKESLELFFNGKNFGYLIKVTALTLLVEMLPIIATVLPIGVLVAMAKNGSESGVAYALLVILALMGGIITFVALLWAQIVTILVAQNVISGKIGPVADVLKRAWSGKIAQLFLLLLLLGLIIGFGLLFFIVPGILFAVWFGYAIYMLILQDKGIMESLSASKELVSGHFWTVLGYNFLFGIITMIVAAILNTVVPFIGSVVISLLSIYFVIFPLLLYRELIGVKGASKTPAKN